MYQRLCPICSTILEYKSKRSFLLGESSNAKCKKCAGIIGYENLTLKNPTFINGFKGKHHTEETKQQISKSHLACSEIYKTPEFRQTMRNAMKSAFNPMRGGSLMSIWIAKYGVEEANKREIKRKEKISNATKGKNNPMFGKPSPTGSGNGICGRYKNFYFRSLRELKFILTCERFNFNIESIERIRIPYVHYDGTNRTYSPDFLINKKFMVEIKPKKLINSPLIKLKTDAGLNYCKNHNINFKIMDFGIVNKDELIKMIDNKLLQFTDKQLKRIYELKQI